MLNNLENEETIHSNSMIVEKKYNIVLCEIFNKHLHDSRDIIEEEILGHYLTIYKWNWKYLCSSNDENTDDENTDDGNTDDDYSDIEYVSDLNIIQQSATFQNDHYNHLKENMPTLYSVFSKHPFIRNFQNIIERQNYIKPEIAQCIYLEGGQCISIIKTFWIKVIQRSWKKVYQERKNILLKRRLYKSILHRELKGTWPKYCIRLPGLYGLLS